MALHGHSLLTLRKGSERAMKATAGIHSNYHWRQFKYRYEVPDDVLADQFEHLNEEEGYDGFLEYRGYWYHVSDFMAASYPFSDTPPLFGWHGYLADTFFSGVVINISDDGEEYQIGTYLS